MGPLLRVFGYVGIVLAGALVGVVGSFQHGNEFYLGGVGVPFGLVLGLVLTALVTVTAGLGTRSRSGAGLALAGWVLSVLLMSSQRPEGDLIVAATPLGMIWLFGGTVLGGICLAWPYRRAVAGAAPALQPGQPHADDPGEPVRDRQS